VLVAHSNAGVFMPAIRARRLCRFVFFYEAALTYEVMEAAFVVTRELNGRGASPESGSCCALLVGYPCGMSTDVWVGAITTLVGGLLGGAISFVVSRQQAKDARRQRAEDDIHDRRRRSEDRRYTVYSDFLSQVRSFRNALEAYYARPRDRPRLSDLDSLLHSANDKSALVFLVVESRETYEGCRSVLRALRRSRVILHKIEESPVSDPWRELNMLLGQATRDFQNAARNELGVSGPTVPWDDQAELGPPTRA
jgi:hypothetical protein